ncbi:hypothetical protein [Paludibacter jiangxiensis]|nr:hypothetical protein [Paludibacter jiangxiensis]
MFTPAAIVAPLKSSVASFGIASRMALKSRASMVPVTARSVTAVNYILASAAKCPAVVVTVWLSVACATKKRHKKNKRVKVFLILVVYCLHFSAKANLSDDAIVILFFEHSEPVVHIDPYGFV